MHMKIAFITAMLLAAANIAWAEPQTNDDQSQLVAQVVRALEKCEWKVTTSNGGPKGLMLLHRAKMRRVLEQINAGRSIDPKEVAEVFKGHSS
jgi:hypothetical protein